MRNASRSLLGPFLAATAISLLDPTCAFDFGFGGASKPTKNLRVIRVCHSKDCAKKGGGEVLLDTFRDLLPAQCEGTSCVSVERSGCLSQCGKGPNVSVVDNGGPEKMYFAVEDPMAASAVLDVATGEEYPIDLLVASMSISEAEHATSPSKKESCLSSAISAVTKDGDPALLDSFARAHALMLRADARLDLPSPDVGGAIADAELASKIAPKERRAWRALAGAREAGGDAGAAMQAVEEWVRVDPSFSAKGKREMERLQNLKRNLRP